MTSTLSCNGAHIELHPMGAAIHRITLPTGQNVVLTPNQNERNPFYMGAIVGRVANRIANGTLGDGLQLEINNPPNHLHGGSGGFSHQLWTKISTPEQSSHAEYRYTSPDGDQGYPGEVMVRAVYSVQPKDTDGVTLRLELYAEWPPTNKEDLRSPINLSNHTYWNLGNGLLQHTVQLPNCQYYTPVNEVSIPTRHVVAVEGTCMDFSKPRLLEEALRDYAIRARGMTATEADRDILQARPEMVHFSKEPYGFDHNYVVTPSSSSDMTRVAILSSESVRLTVSSTAPGVQLYTGNYLPRPWTGICFETQHYPDSLQVEPGTDFAKGACPWLSAESPTYRHVVQYDLEWKVQ